MSGQTIEVLNTDAEGRMVLADCLWYAQERFKPKALINLATLTGAVMVALGKEHAGLFTNSDELAERLTAAGNVTGERLWRERLGGKHQASPVAGAEKIYLAGEDGRVTVLKPGPTFEVLARNNLGEPIVATPALSNGRIFIRGEKHLFCIEESKK